MSASTLQTTVQTALLGVLAAAVAFSVALATPVESRDAGAGVKSRFVGTNLRFSNPFILAGSDPSFPAGGDVANDPDGFDLGDVAVGSQFVRLVTALGGVRHYAFTPLNPATGMTLQPNGRVTGQVASPVGSFFNASVTDAASQTRNGFFRLVARNEAATAFRFAMDRLPSAQVGNDYMTIIETINGTAANTTYSVVPNSVLLNGVPSLSLEFFGLQLFRDGTLAGRPLASGTLSFTARATKGTAVARSRSNASSDQTFAITIAAESFIQSVLATSRADISGEEGRQFKNKAKFNFFVNTEGRGNSSFAASPFTLRLAGSTFSTTLDSNGQSRSGDLRVKLDSTKGTLQVDLFNVNFAALVGSIPDRFNLTLIAVVEIGNTFIGTEAIQFDTRNRRSKYSLKYALGKERQLGGLFQVVTLKAQDGFSGTAFKTKFLVSHVKGRSDVEFGTPTSAAVHIGQGFDQTVSLRRGRGSFRTVGVRSLKIDGKRKLGELQTTVLPQSQTGIPPASSSGGQTQTFLLGMDITTSTTLISGDASRKIFPVVFR